MLWACSETAALTLYRIGCGSLEHLEIAHKIAEE